MRAVDRRSPPLRRPERSDDRDRSRRPHAPAALGVDPSSPWTARLPRTDHRRRPAPDPKRRGPLQTESLPPARTAATSRLIMHIFAFMLTLYSYNISPYAEKVRA